MTEDSAEKSPKNKTPLLNKSADYLVIDTLKPAPKKFIKIDATKLNMLDISKITVLKKVSPSSKVSTNRNLIKSNSVIKTPILAKTQTKPLLLPLKESFTTPKPVKHKSNSKNNDVIIIDDVTPVSSPQKSTAAALKREVSKVVSPTVTATKALNDSLQNDRPIIFAGDKLTVNNEIVVIDDETIAVGEETPSICENDIKLSEIDIKSNSPAIKGDFNTAITPENNYAKELSFSKVVENAQASSSTKTKSSDAVVASCNLADKETTEDIDQQVPVKPKENENHLIDSLKSTESNQQLDNIKAVATTHLIPVKLTENFDLKKVENSTKEADKNQTESEDQMVLNFEARTYINNRFVNKDDVIVLDENYETTVVENVNSAEVSKSVVSNNITNKISENQKYSLMEVHTFDQTKCKDNNEQNKLNTEKVLTENNSDNLKEDNSEENVKPDSVIKDQETKVCMLDDLTNGNDEQNICAAETIFISKTKEVTPVIETDASKKKDNLISQNNEVSSNKALKSNDELESAFESNPICDKQGFSASNEMSNPEEIDVLNEITVNDSEDDLDNKEMLLISDDDDQLLAEVVC